MWIATTETITMEEECCMNYAKSTVLFYAAAYFMTKFKERHREGLSNVLDLLL